MRVCNLDDNTPAVKANFAYRGWNDIKSCFLNKINVVVAVYMKIKFTVKVLLFYT